MRRTVFGIYLYCFATEVKFNWVYFLYFFFFSLKTQLFIVTEGIRLTEQPQSQTSLLTMPKESLEIPESESVSHSGVFNSFDLMYYSPPGYSVHGILWERILAGLPFPSSEEFPFQTAKNQTPQFNFIFLLLFSSSVVSNSLRLHGWQHARLFLCHYRLTQDNVFLFSLFFLFYVN